MAKLTQIVWKSCSNQAHPRFPYYFCTNVATPKSPATKRLFSWSYNSRCSIALNKNYALVAFSICKCIYRGTSKGKWFHWHLFCEYSSWLLVLEQANCGWGITPRHVILGLVGYDSACHTWEPRVIWDIPPSRQSSCWSRRPQGICDLWQPHTGFCQCQIPPDAYK